MELQRYEEAYIAYDHVLEKYPQWIDPWVNKASALLCLGKYDEAVAACDQALMIEPDHYFALSYREMAKEQIHGE